MFMNDKTNSREERLNRVNYETNGLIDFRETDNQQSCKGEIQS